ncbi:MAG: MFS transporter [Pseudomonadota bacterium]
MSAGVNPVLRRHEANDSEERMNFFSSKWFLLVVFCLVQVLTTTDNMTLSNAMSAIVESFHTSVAALQTANAIYPLVASATMIVFGLLGVRWGWKRLLQLGVIALAVGEVIAAASPGVIVFTYIARVLTGLGASMAIPAVLALTANMFQGRELVFAFGALGAASGIAAAAGPVGSGLVIVGLGWRWAFWILAGLFVLTFFGTLGLQVQHNRPTSANFDVLGSILATVGLVTLVFGLLMVTSWGLVTPVHAPFTIFGISPCGFLLVGSAFVFFLFLGWERHRESSGLSVLMPRAFRNTPEVRAGLYMNAVVFFVMGSFSFVIITYLQIVLAYDAVQSGAVFSVYAVGMVVFSMGTPAMFKGVSPRRICQGGILVLAFSSLWLAYGLQTSVTNPSLLVGLFLAGVGSGLVASQCSSVIAVAIPQSLAEQSGGVQGTARNVGQTLGVAIVGAILIGGLTQSIKDQVHIDKLVGPEMQARIALVKEANFLSNQDARRYLEAQKLPQEQVAQLMDINQRARLQAARMSVLGMGALCLLFLFPTASLPHQERREAGART